MEMQLVRWFDAKNRKPLVLRGARQVGKSTLVKIFCENQKLDLFEINLQLHRNLEGHFKNLDLEKLIIEFEAICNKKFSKNSNNSQLLFLDEIQEIPQALEMLRYFYEKMPHLPVIAAGSLLEFVLSDHTFSFPVGRIEFMHLGPMTFSEYLEAVNDSYLLNELQSLNAYNFKSWPKTLHDRALSHLKKYFYIGGMPEAIRETLNDRPDSALQIHANIVETYRSDFYKYTKKKNLPFIENTFQYCGLNIGKKVKYANISNETSSKNIKECIDLLVKARVIIKSIHSNCSGLPLEITKDDNVYKQIFLDIGLANYLAKISWPQILKHDEKNLFLLNHGSMAEQFIGQHLAYSKEHFRSPELFYWIREGKANNAELDYIDSFEDAIVAIEIKAGEKGKLRSLHQWNKDIKYKNKISIRFDLNMPSEQIVKYNFPDLTEALEYKLISLPLYCVEYIRNFIAI